MSYFKDSLIFLGSQREAGISIYRFNSSVWERVTSVGDAIPRSMNYDHRLNGLYVFSEAAGTPSVASYAIKNEDPVLTWKAVQEARSLPKAAHLQHMCVDLDPKVAYAVGRKNVNAFLQNADATIFFPFDRTYVCLPLAINADFIVKQAFISKSHQNFESFFEVFCINYWPGAPNQRIFIKFKYQTNFDDLNDTDAEVQNYYTCVVNLRNSSIYTYENCHGKFKDPPSFTYTFPQNRECSTSTIADVVAARKNAFLFVANREHKSVTSFTFSFGQNKLLAVENYPLPSGWVPKRLFFNGRNNCLYVATKNKSIVIFRVVVPSGKMRFIQTIFGIPSPTCMVAT